MALHRSRGPSRWSIFERLKEEYDNAVPGEHHWEQAPKHSDKPTSPLSEDAEEDQFFAADVQVVKPDEKPDYEPYCVVAVGTTGAGKSTLVKLFCGDKVKVGHNTVSDTKDITIFEEVGADADAKRLWMDTQGTDDSFMDEVDEKILKKIFKRLYERKLVYVKILWMVSGDMDRQKGEYRKQADFISGFQTKESKKSVFLSTLVIQKMGQLKPKEKQMRGVIDAAKAAGADFADRAVSDFLMGFKALDLMNLEEDDVYQSLVEYGTPEPRMMDLGYLRLDQMKEQVNTRLASLPCFKITFLDRRCKKCSLRGDPRYIYAKCHYEAQPKHPMQLEPYHPEELVWRHFLDTTTFHPEAVVTVHPEELEQFHPLPGVEVEVDDKSDVTYSHPERYIERGCCTGPARWRCCNNTDPDHRGCVRTYGRKKVMQFDCCDRTSDDGPGCSRRHTCCNRPEGREGCVTKWECCEQPPDADGCRTQYKCCEQDLSSQGCQQRFTCCEMPDGARGCEDRFPCCNQGPQTSGCVTVCSRCDIQWGKTPGCCWPDYDQEALQIHPEEHPVGGASSGSEDMKTDDDL